MNADDIRRALERHAAWLRGERDGRQADFRGADLRGASLRWVVLCDADLRGADFRGADLGFANLRWSRFRGADLRGADFREADLRDSDFREADLRNADFCGADLRGVSGFLLLPVQDPRGHSFVHAIQCDDGWRIRVGCHDFSIDEAREHWGDDYMGDREIADAYLYAVAWLERKVASMEKPE